MGRCSPPTSNPPVGRDVPRCEARNDFGIDRNLAQAMSDAGMLGKRALAHATAMPTKRAVVCDGASLTYGELARAASSCAGRLQQRGFGPGGRTVVGVLAAPSLDYVVVTLACQLAGVTQVPLPGLVAPDAHARMIDDASIAVIFHDAASRAKLDLVDEVRGKPPVSRVGFDMADSVDVDSFAAWIGDEAPSFESVSIRDFDVSDLIYSSGTTGEPKGITQTYEARRAQCESLALLGMGQETNLLQTVGLASNFGFSSALLTLWWGATLFLMPKFSGEAALKILSDERITMAWCPPTALVRMVETPGFAEAVAEKPCVKSSAGAPLTEAQKLQVLETWPGAFVETYGQTETGTLTALPVHEVPRSKVGSVGRPLSTVSLKIIDEDGTVLPPGHEGEIVAASTTMMAGYHHRTDDTASTNWMDNEGRRHVRTGDIGRLDDDGYLWLCGRKKDLIISGGYNIYPVDIEQVASGHPAILDAAVVGAPSQRWGESPIAFVTLRAGQEVDPETLRDWINARVGAIQRVAAVRVLADLPRGGMDKVLKGELRKLCRDMPASVA